MTYVQCIGYVAAGLGIVTFAMQTMIPLRVTGIAHNLGQIAFGLLAGIYPTVIQHVILLPINCYRLLEMFNLIRKVEVASEGDHSLDWLRPFMSKRSIKAGEILCRKGEKAFNMYFVLEGRLHLEEINMDMEPGAIVGELGMLAPDRKRTQTVICTANGSVLEIAYSRLEQICHQNPAFGFYFLRLSTQRLFDNIERLGRTLAERDSELRQLRSMHAQLTMSGITATPPSAICRSPSRPAEETVRRDALIARLMPHHDGPTCVLQWIFEPPKSGPSRRARPRT